MDFPFEADLMGRSLSRPHPSLRATFSRREKETHAHMSNSLPGFMMPSGSSTRLIPRITAISSALRVDDR
jgi:hypothetical protein